MIELLNEQIDYVKVHYYRKRIQDATYREHIKGLKDGELVIHVDYSENYKNKKQSEINAGYYGQGQFSLFTVAIYMKQNDDTVCKNYALITRENDHSCNISFELNNFILSTMQANYDIKTVKFWSEGCVSQFRSQFDFFMLSKVDHSINIEWNYFEANHGKGVVDGIGGTVKHAVYSHVLTNRVVIKSPKQLAEYVNEILPKITVQYVENESMELRYQSECQEKAKKVKGTLKVQG